MRGTDSSYRDALDEAFKRTGVSKDKFVATKWDRDANGSLGEGPHQPHTGYQTPGKGANRVRGHIFVEDVPATRRKIEMSNVTEILKVSDELEIDCRQLTEKQSIEFIALVNDKFSPEKIFGHVSIGRNAVSIPLEGNEFTFSMKLPEDKAFVFFCQEGVDRNKVVSISDVSKWCNIMAESYGMEYFISNPTLDYLIAVNWYVIEIEGEIKKSFI